MFGYSGGKLCCEEVQLEEIARQCGTPCYVYSAGSILRAYREYDGAFGDLPHTVCYAVKANSTLAVLSLLSRAGAGFDIVSGGELFRVLQAGGDPSQVVFSGVGKTTAEMDYALRQGIHSFNCESLDELGVINEVAEQLGVTARVSLRVNPDVDAATHPYISTGLRDHKFGIDIAEAPAAYAEAANYNNLQASGVSCHIGSQILDPSPILEAAGKVLSLAERLQSAGHSIDHVDLGGGLGIAYRKSESAPDIQSFVGSLRSRLQADKLTVFVEPGRSIVGPAGLLLTKVLYRKRSPKKEFVVVDAAMNDLIRPALYQSHHEILTVDEEVGGAVVADVVGPVCESGDFLARSREMPDVRAGQLLAIGDAGAYGFAQSSNYNSRPRAAEVLVTGDRWRVIRERESLQDLIRGETR